MMPDMYGLTLLEELKKDRFLSKIPVIMQTGTSDEKELDKCYKLGAISHIAKPYEKKMLLETISKILSEN
jgi:two-component system sensor histidine kinase ChiS